MRLGRFNVGLCATFFLSATSKVECAFVQLLKCSPPAALSRIRRGLRCETIAIHKQTMPFSVAPSAALKLMSEATRTDEKVKKMKSNGFDDGDSTKMDSTQVGSLTVPSVGIGTISWSSDSITSLRNPELQSLAFEARASGVSFFDTAERYGGHMTTAVGLGWGETEKLLQKFLSNTETDEVNTFGSDSIPVIATKFTPSPWRMTKESVVKACEQSCQRLGVSSIDLYQLHMPDIVQPLKCLGLASPKDRLYWEGLAECYHRGLVKNIGVCNYGPTLLSQCHEALAIHSVPLASNQIPYSLIGRRNGAQETVDKCHELGVKVLAYYPFAMGLLTGKYSSDSMEAHTRDATSLTASKRSKIEISDLRKYAEGDGEQIPLGGIRPVIRAIEAIAKKRGKSVAQVALNYCICKGVVPIPGARTVSQLRDNLGAMHWRLNKDEIALLEYEADKLGFSFEGAGFKKTSEKFVGYGVEKWTLD